MHPTCNSTAELSGTWLIRQVPGWTVPRVTFAIQAMPPSERQLLLCFQPAAVQQTYSSMKLSHMADIATTRLTCADSRCQQHSRAV